MNIIVFSTHNYDKLILEEASNDKHTLSYIEESLSLDNVHLAKGYEGVAVFGTDNVNSAVINYLSDHGTKYIGTRSVGFDHIDMTAANDCEIKVANVPVYSPYAIAEHAVGLLLAQNRKLITAQKLMNIQDFRLDQLIGFDIHGKTIGIIGLGAIGRAFANIMKGFGCTILANDIIPNQKMIAQGVRYVELDSLLSEADIVYVTCPLNKSTHHLIGQRELSLMKPNATLINTARGAVVDTKALINHLENGNLYGVCLDVYEYEKGMYFNDWREREIEDKLYQKLRSVDRVLMTAHQGFLTHNALTQIAVTTMNNFEDWENSIKCVNEI